MVVVVQTFTTTEPGDCSDVGCRVVEVLVADYVAGAVDHRIHHDVAHTLGDECCHADDWSDPATKICGKAADENRQSSSQSQPAAVEHKVGARERHVLGVFLNDLGFVRLFGVIDRVPKKNVPQTFEVRAVWITLFVSKMMMLAMYCHPLASNDSGEKPKLNTHQHSNGWM